MKTIVFLFLVILIAACQRPFRTQKRFLSYIPADTASVVELPNFPDSSSLVLQNQPSIENRVGVLGKMLGMEEQHFEISSIADTVLRGRYGTRLLIPENSFLRADGTSPEDVSITFIEVRTPLEMIAQHLSCYTTDNRILQSAGSFYLGASSDGEELGISPDVGITAQFSTGGKKIADMREFTGVTQLNGTTIWNKSCDRLNTIERPEKRISGSSYRGYQVNPLAYERYLRFEPTFCMDNKYVGNAMLKNGSTVNNWLGEASIRKNRILCDYFEAYKFKVNVELMFRNGKVWKMRFNPLIDSVFRAEMQLWMEEIPALGQHQLVDFHWYNCVISTRGTNPYTVEQQAQMMRYFRCVDRGSTYYYEIPVTSTGWVNCDAYASFEGEKTAMKVNHDRGTSVYLILPDNNAALLPDKQENCCTVFPPIPAGLKVTIVSIKTVGKTLYASVKKLNVESKSIEMDRPMRMTPRDLIQLTRN